MFLLSLIVRAFLLRESLSLSDWSFVRVLERFSSLPSLSQVSFAFVWVKYVIIRVEARPFGSPRRRTRLVELKTGCTPFPFLNLSTDVFSLALTSL